MFFVSRKKFIAAQARILALEERLRRGQFEDIAARREALLRQYGNMSIHDIARKCGKPDDEYIGRDDLPHKLNEANEDDFLFWASLTGDVFHTKRGCHPAAVYPCNAANLGDRRPCARCKPRLPDLSWHVAYRGVIREFENCGLPHPRPHIDGHEGSGLAARVRYSVDED